MQLEPGRLSAENLSEQNANRPGHGQGESGPSHNPRRVITSLGRKVKSPYPADAGHSNPFIAVGPVKD
jgi:hypothetical protein